MLFSMMVFRMLRDPPYKQEKYFLASMAVSLQKVAIMFDAKVSASSMQNSDKIRTS